MKGAEQREVESGCVNRSVKRRRGKEWKEVRDAWRDVSEGGEERQKAETYPVL